MTVNTYQDETITSHDLLQMLFQIEELYENGEMNYSEKDQMLKLAFRSYTGSDQFTLNKLYKLKSVVVQASRMVLQAVGPAPESPVRYSCAASGLTRICPPVLC